MEFTEVTSSSLHSHRYDPVDERLLVRFHCSACKDKVLATPCLKCAGRGYTTYQYDRVSPDRWVAIRDAKSTGTAFHQHIRSAKDARGDFLFKGTKLD